MNDLGLYVHWPFCIVKCPYCDFNSHKITNYNENDWLNAYLTQIDFLKTFCCNNFIKTNKLSSIFFGGGTPNTLRVRNLNNIMESLETAFEFDKHIEITMEMNPGLHSKRKCKEYFSCGINRVSIGAQSMNDNELGYLGRGHSSDDTKRFVNELQDVGFSNMSLDFIYGLPNQTKDSVKNSLKKLEEKVR